MGAGRIRNGVRLSAVAASAAGLALFSRGAGKRHFAKSLASIPGIPAKAAQLLSILDGGGAVRGAPAGPCLGLGEVKALLLERMPRLCGEIDSIDPHGRSASLGQVHRARLDDGREVAIKLRLPGVEAEIDAQLALLATLGSVAPQGRFGLDLEAHRRHLSEKFSEELDYRVEARRQDAFHSDWSGDASIVIPRVHAEFVSASVLVQSFEDSLEAEEAVRSATDVEKRTIATALSRFVLGSLLRTGRIHADLHSGNWGWRRGTGEVVIYDFGSVLQPGPRECAGFRCLLEGAADGDAERIHAGFDALGFSMEKLEPVRGALPRLAGALLAPFLSGEPWRASEWNLQARLDEILGAEKWTFRAAGAPWFLLLMRSLAGWHHALSLLDVPVETGRILGEILGRSPGDPGRTADLRYSGDGAAASRLYVSVVKRGSADEEVVRLELPARAIDGIEDLLPAEGRRRMEEMGVGLAELKARARESGMRPQTLVDAADDQRRYRVWLA